MRRIGAALAVFALLFVLARVANLAVEWAWFSSLGFVDVFWTTFFAKVVLFVVCFLVSTILLWANAPLALRFASGALRRGRSGVFTPSFATFSPPGSLDDNYRLLPSALAWRLIVLVVSIMLGRLVALGETSHWALVLRFLRQAPYGRSDPQFGKDIGFYLFSLPAYVALKNWFFLLLTLAGLMAARSTSCTATSNLDPPHWSASPAAIAHGSALLGLFLAGQGVVLLSRPLSPALRRQRRRRRRGYADVHIELPALWLLVVAVLAATALSSTSGCASAARRRGGVAGLRASFVFGDGSPGAVQRFYVKPNELQLETPYIERTIALTREAYNLGDRGEAVSRGAGLTFQSLQTDSATVENIRLWDWRPLLAAYAQLQEIRTYYQFLDVDVDRYHLGGDYQQVMISARELVPSLLPADAQTWVNLHLLFTHGYGVGHVAGHAQVARRPADLLSEGHPAGRATAAPRSASRASILAKAPTAM